MPAIITSETGLSAEFDRVELDYNYPEGLDWRPSNDTNSLHRKLRDELFSRASESAGAISNRFDSWNEIDRTLTAYIDLSTSEKAIKSKDNRKPVSIVFPNSYAILETLLSYMVAAFFQDPIFMYEGVDGDDTIGAILLEKIVQLHCHKTKVPLALHTMWRDAFAYGFGVSAPYWKIHKGNKTVKKETGFFSDMKNRFVGNGFEKDTERNVVLFEGNALQNIDPYLSLPDPNFSIHEIQDGEFFGWVEKTNLMDLLSREEANPEEWFNVRYLKGVKRKGTSIYGMDNSGRGDKTVKNSVSYNTSGQRGSAVRTGNKTTPVDIIHMVMKIIPSELGLGKGEYPEKWLFSLASDDIIVRAKPINLDHNNYPIAVAAPDFDGYSSTPVSRMEMLYGLQGTLDWLFNAHIANVRKAVNDRLIYDPYLVNSKDLSKPKPGGLIRMRRPAWGKGVKDAVQQLAITDITREHIADSSFIVNWMQKIGGADEQTLMGATRQGGPERLTKGEFQGTQRAAMNRMERLAMIISWQSMKDIGLMFATHAQQMMTQEEFVKVSGRWQQVLLREYGMGKVTKNRGRIKVSPFDILVNYDVVVKDGSIPGGNFSEVWIRLFETVMKFPELAQEFDSFRIFSHIARNSGAKNVEEFRRIKTEVMDNEDVLRGADKGNIVPIRQYTQ